MARAELLVLGATGKVGRILARQTWGEQVLWQSRAPREGHVIWTAGAPLPPARYVLMLSGVTGGTPEDLAANVALGRAVAAAAVQAGVDHLFLASTMAVYGRTPHQGAFEETPPDQPNAYGLAKWQTEAAMAQGLTGQRTGLTALRLGNVVGADLLGVVHARGGPIGLDQFDSGLGPIRSYIGGAHLAHVLRGLMDHHRAGGALPERLNVAGREPVPMCAILRAAGLAFTPQTPGAAALERVVMRTDALEALVPARPDLEGAAALARDWLER